MGLLLHVYIESGPPAMVKKIKQQSSYTPYHSNIFDNSTLLNGPDLITRIDSQRETSTSKKRLLDSTNNTPTSQALSNKASEELSDRRGILSRRRSWHSIWVWLFDFVVDAGTSLWMSRSWKECRHLAQDVSILERVSSPRSGCLDLGKGVGYGTRLHKRRLYDLRGYEHICEYEYICELRGYE